MLEVKHWRIPLHPLIPQMQQLQIPDKLSKRRISSYARFVARKFEKNPDDLMANMKVKSVKVYRVIHAIAPASILVNGIAPTDPELYRPYYVGHFDPDGKLIEDNDPYLYWLVPILRKDGNDPMSDIEDYCRLHAGDSHWCRRVNMNGEPEWIERAPPRRGEQ